MPLVGDLPALQRKGEGRRSKFQVVVGWSMCNTLLSGLHLLVPDQDGVVRLPMSRTRTQSQPLTKRRLKYMGASTL